MSMPPPRPDLEPYAAIVLEELASFEPVVVYVFGSRVTGTVHPGSDLDIALLSSTPCDPVELFVCANRLAARLQVETDLVDLATASTVLRKEVVGTGYPILGSESVDRAEFEMYALSDYARLNEERAPVLAALSQ